jgi:hypothetical protein
MLYQDLIAIDELFLDEEVYIEVNVWKFVVVIIIGCLF